MMECDQTATADKSQQQQNTTASSSFSSFSSFSSSSECMSFSVNPTSAFGVLEETYRNHHHQYHHPYQSCYNGAPSEVGSSAAAYPPTHQNAHYHYLPPTTTLDQTQSSLEFHHPYSAVHYQSSQYSSYMNIHPHTLASMSQSENVYWNSTSPSSLSLNNSISTSTTTSQNGPNPSDYTFGEARNYPLSSSSSSSVDSTGGVYPSLPKHQRRPKKRQVRVRKRRVLFSHVQIHALEQSFESNQYLSSPNRELLARTLNLTKKQVTIWFQNNRFKTSRDFKKKIMDEVVEDILFFSHMVHTLKVFPHMQTNHRHHQRRSFKAK